eukprot:gene15756-biopygen17082
MSRGGCSRSESKLPILHAKC